MSLHLYLSELELKGASIYIQDGALQASAPPGVLTNEIRTYLRENRSAVMDVLLRRETIKARQAAAYEKALRNSSLCWDIDRGEPKYAAAESLFESTVIQFIDGEVPIDAVSKAWKELMKLHKIPAQASAEYAAAG